jgi:hypothetical protein
MRATAGRRAPRSLFSFSAERSCFCSPPAAAAPAIPLPALRLPPKSRAQQRTTAGKTVPAIRDRLPGRRRRLRRRPTTARPRAIPARKSQAALPRSSHPRKRAGRQLPRSRRRAAPGSARRATRRLRARPRKRNRSQSLIPALARQPPRAEGPEVTRPSGSPLPKQLDPVATELAVGADQGKTLDIGLCD